MKKALSVFLLLLCIVSLTACNKEQTKNNNLLSADLAVFDENGLTGETIDPTSTGKVTIINFWGTWCPYCLKEMPHLDQIADKYPQQISVIAVHTDISNTDAVEYVAENFPNSAITFANDAKNLYYAQMGGNGSYPYTVVLDRNGTVSKIFYGYKDYESWLAVVEGLIK